MKTVLYLLTVFRDSSNKSITNIEDFVTYETLDAAIEYYNIHYANKKLPYTIEETYEESISDLDSSDNDNEINDDISYWVAPDCEEWDEYYWPYKTLSEAKVHAKECVKVEHCGVHIEKHYKKVVKEG